jgi:hypothetical protein
MLKRALFGCLLGIIVSACAAGPPILGPSTGTVSGHVSVRVCGGAYRTDQTGCPARPLTEAIVSFRLTSANGAAREQTAVTDASGAYTIKLAPGTYTVTLTAAWIPVVGSSQASPVPARTVPRQVTVAAGKTVTADLTYTIQLL